MLKQNLEAVRPGPLRSSTGEDRRPRRAAPRSGGPHDSLRRPHLHRGRRLDGAGARRRDGRVRRVRPGRGRRHPRRRRALPDVHRHHHPGHRRQGWRRRHHRRPVRRDQGGPQRVLPARVRRPGRGRRDGGGDPRGLARGRRDPPGDPDAGMTTGDDPAPAGGVTARAALVRLVRDEGRRVLATLVRHTGDLQLAEDAVQDAVLRALDAWPRTGVPPQPRAWLTLTARNRAVDLVRRESARTGKEAEAVALVDRFGPGPPADEPPELVRDDQLRLVFTCCHPALALETQVALALHTLCGLTTAEVGRALLVPEATMSKRLTRAKHKIARAGIPYRVPDAAELPDRLRGVAATTYLLFTEGYARPDGGPTVDEAVRLARLLRELMPDEPSVLGLLALLVLQESHRPV